MIVQTVVDILMETPAVAARFGDRIYPGSLPDEPTFPCVLVTKSSGVGQYVFAGDTDIERARVQVDVYGSKGYAAMLQDKRAIRATLSAFRGGPASGNACAIDTCKCINDQDGAVLATERAGPRLRHRMLEFEIWNREL